MARRGNAARPVTAATATSANKTPGSHPASGPGPVANKELLQRMNFLHQASVLVAGAVNDSARLAEQVRLKSGKRGRTEDRSNRKSRSPSPRYALRSAAGRGENLIPTQMEPDNRDAKSSTITDHVDLDGDRSISSSTTLPAFATSSSTTVAATSTFTPAGWEIPTPRQQAQMDLLDRRTRYIGQNRGPPGLQKGQGRKGKRQAPEAMGEVRTVKKKQSQDLSIGELLSLNIQRPGTASDGKRAMVNEKGSKADRKKSARPTSNKNLSSHFVHDINAIARKSVLRIDPNIKRTMCRNCKSLLIPGVTSSVRILPSGPHVHTQRTKCLQCGVTRTIPCPPLLGAEPEPETSIISDAPEIVDVSMDVGLSEAAPMPQTQGTASPLPDSGVPRTREDREDSDAAAGGAGKRKRDTDEEDRQEEPEGTASMTTKGDLEHRTKRHKKDSSMVPGSVKQYRRRNFHERKEHGVWRGTERVQKD